MIIIKPLLMIPKNQNPPFWRQNLTVRRHLPVYDVNVTSQTKKLNNWRTTRHRELVNPSFCSVWVGDLFMNNFIWNFAPSVWKYTENELYDVMWRHMTSYDVTWSDFQKKLRDDILDHDYYSTKIWSKLDEQEINGVWMKKGPKNGIMTS